MVEGGVRAKAARREERSEETSVIQDLNPVLQELLHVVLLVRRSIQSSFGFSADLGRQCLQLRVQQLLLIRLQ